MLFARHWADDVQDNVPDALRPLPILGLRLHLGRMPLLQLRCRDGIICNFSDPVYDAQKATGRTLFAARSETARALPRKLAYAIRTLRVLAIVDEERRMDYDGTLRAPPQGAEALHDQDAYWDDYEYQDAWYSGQARSLEWWRIIRDGDEVVRLDVLTADQGRKVQRFFENADLETLQHIDGEDRSLRDS